MEQHKIEILIPKSNVINLKGYFADKQLENKTQLEQMKILIKRYGFKNIISIIEKIYF